MTVASILGLKGHTAPITMLNSAPVAQNQLQTVWILVCVVVSSQIFVAADTTGQKPTLASDYI